MLTRTPLILLAALALTLAGQPLFAQDQLVKQALKKIASVEAAMPALTAGDVRAANKLLADLKWANKRLNAAYKKNTTHWQSASKRLTAADKRIRATASATPAGKPSGKQPPRNNGGRSVPTPPANGTSGGKAASGPVIGEQFARLQQLHKEVNNGFRNLNLLNKTYMGDAYRVGSTTKELSKLQARLAEFPSGDKNVKVVAAGLQKFAALQVGFAARQLALARILTYGGWVGGLDRCLDYLYSEIAFDDPPARIDPTRTFPARARPVRGCLSRNHAPHQPPSGVLMVHALRVRLWPPVPSHSLVPTQI
jgi:hypothetical protein